ncbi:MAG TPA: hypothetical protein VN328_09010 [Thermodesulfovibrionales bacterium]|nr:hypothetical protein [Thermodesulfovibrionales bacterium]
MNRRSIIKSSSYCSSVNQDGIALLLVLWVLTVLMVIVLSFSLTARTETYSTLSFREGVEKKFLAEAGLQRGISEIFYRRQNLNVEGGDFWKTDGTPYSDRLGEGEYSVRIIDESGKIDINMLNDSSGIILKNLLINAGVGDDTANTIVDSVLDWKDKNEGMHRLNGAGDDYYASLPNPYKVKHADFDTVEELMLIKGVTPEILFGSGKGKGIIDFLTVYSRVPTISIKAAPREVLVAVPGITPEIADAIISSRADNRIINFQEVGLPPQGGLFFNMMDSSTFSLESVGIKGDGKTGYKVKATVRIEADNKYKFVYYKSPVTVNQ